MKPFQKSFDILSYLGVDVLGLSLERPETLGGLGKGHLVAAGVHHHVLHVAITLILQDFSRMDDGTISRICRLFGMKEKLKQKRVARIFLKAVTKSKHSLRKKDDLVATPFGTQVSAPKFKRDFR